MTARGIVHKFSSAIADGANAAQVQKTNWDDEHQYTGTSLSSGDFTLTNCGGGAALSSIAGVDCAHTFTLTVGTSPTVNPTVKLTFKDGAFTNAPIVIVQLVGGTAEVCDVSVVRDTVSYTITLLDLPINTKTYIFNVIIAELK